jgi:hypothetical protein
VLLLAFRILSDHTCLFSYGQTGSGKTWSMVGQGMGDQRGIIPRSVEKVLEQAAELSRGGWSYQLEASFLEIYNEAIKDLLDNKEAESVTTHNSRERCVTVHG